MTRALRAPELSAILSLDSCCTTVVPSGLTSRARRWRPRASAWSWRAGASLRSGRYRPPSRPARRGRPRSYSASSACRTRHADSGGPARPSRSSASCRSPPRRSGPSGCPSCRLPFPQNGLEPRDVPAHAPELQRVLDGLGGRAELEPEALFPERGQLLLQLLGLQLPEIPGLPLLGHLTVPPASRTWT